MKNKNENKAKRQSIASIKPRVMIISTQVGSPAAVRRIVGRELTRIRERIMARDGAACRQCGMMAGRLEVDHVHPLALGGSESDENRQLLCVACHKLKSDKEGTERGK